MRTEAKRSPRAIRSNAAAKLPRAVRGLLTGFSDLGQPLVDFCSNSPSSPVQAISLVDLKSSDVGCEVVLLFEDGDPGRPIIVGCVKGPVQRDTQIDGRQVTLSAENEIVLRCGESSITLTRTGKILIRGAYLLSRSTGVNRIQGGSVQLN